MAKDELQKPESLSASQDAPVNWERAFAALAMATCTGFVASQDVEVWVQFVRKHAGNKPADVIVAIFNRTRSQFMQDFMG